MNKLLATCFLFLVLTSCNKENPQQFTQEALKEILVSTKLEKTTLNQILEAHQGKTILIDVWASWCKDCIEALPKLKELQRNHEEVIYVFLSLDKAQSQWLNAIKKYKITGEHYFVPSGWDGELSDFLNLNWIPRYLVVDLDGSIKLFRAVKMNNKLINNLK